MDVEEIREIIREFEYPSVGDVYRGVKWVANEFIESKRWTDLYLHVIEVDGSLYGYYYEEGSTEMQEDIPPWEYGDNWILYPVESEEVLKTVYHIIK